MRIVLILLLCICAALSNRGATQDCKIIQLGLSGNIDALQKLISKNSPSLSVEESLARHRLWVFWASRLGFFPASVRIEQRAYNLIRRKRSPKTEFRHDLDVINPTQQEESEGLGALVKYLKAVIDGDKVLAWKLRQKLTSFGIVDLSEQESDILACGSNNVLLPIAQGIACISGANMQPTRSMPKLLYQIPSHVYVRWSQGLGEHFSVGVYVDVVLQKGKGIMSIDQERSRLADSGGKVLFVVLMNTLDVDVNAKEISSGLCSAMDRVLDRYSLLIGSDVHVCGKRVDARSSVEISQIVAREMISLSSACSAPASPLYECAEESARP